MTVYPIHIDQGSPNFLEKNHISYCTTVRGSDILRYVIFSTYVKFCPINTFFVNIPTVFSLLAKCVLRQSEMPSQVGIGPRAVVWKTLI